MGLVSLQKIIGIDNTEITRQIVYEILQFNAVLEDITIHSVSYKGFKTSLKGGECSVKINDNSANREIVQEWVELESIELLNGDIIVIESDC